MIAGSGFTAAVRRCIIGLSTSCNDHIIRPGPLAVRGSTDPLKPDIVGMLTEIFAFAMDRAGLTVLEEYGEAQDADKKDKQQAESKPLAPDDIQAWPQLTDLVEMKAVDNALVGR